MISIKNHDLEFIEDGHIYLVDGVIVPSITQILKVKFGNKYNFVSESKLKTASEYGTLIHESIEKWCKHGEESDYKEFKNFKFLKKLYNFEVINNEVPVILFDDDEPIAAGRLDLVLRINNETGGADIKCTSTLDKEYVCYQLNLYRIAYLQCYGVDWKFLKGVHLKGDKRKLVDVPINEQMAWELVDEWRASNE